LQKAMELCWENMDEEIQQITALKNYMRDKLLQEVPGIDVNGETDTNGSLYTVLSVSLPPTDHNDLLLFQLDMAGVCASGGSACNSGAAKGSHVLEAIGHPTDRQTIRFSFGRFSTREEVDIAVSAVKKILSVEQPV
ncbi:MAG: aminotransferase class V-fold PLP-dependent enzyme, partial [Bacteroidetes bacterium]|nr:aminotransferase class V-fold PLP-dependent enzyme [Bacteroidota bacterium]